MSKVFQPLKLIAPLIIGGIFIFVFFVNIFSESKTNFEEIALGANTISLFANVEGHPIHCKDMEDARQCIDGFKDRGHVNTVLWLGNSQVHAVNQYQTGQENGPPQLFRKLSERDIDLITFSQPNANLQEHYVLFEYLSHNLPISILILPVVFDDLRENGIRTSLTLALNDSTTRKSLKKSSVGQAILDRQDTQPALSSDIAALQETVQERSEKFFNDWLEKHSSLWAIRSEIRGQLLNSLYRFRNMVLGIDPSSKRRLIRGRYSQNMASLQAILNEARNKKIQVLVYIVPIRNDVEIPYDKKEYAAFKKDVEKITAMSGSQFINLENLIPGRLWGTKDATTIGGEAELDFMHFQAEGHTLLAEALFLEIENLINESIQP